MKKVLLTLATVMVALSAAAATPFSVENRIKLIPGGHPDMRSVEITTPINIERPALNSRAEDSQEVFYTLAGDPYYALSLNNQAPGMQVAMAFQIDPTFLNGVTDGVISEITFFTGTNEIRTNRITQGWVFITDNLSGEFLYTQQVAEIPKTEFTQVNVPLDTPFEIPADSKIFVGAYFTLTNANDAPFVVDNADHINDYGGWYAARYTSNAEWTWDNISAYYGFFTLGATIKGNNMPKNNVSLLAVAGQPTVSENEPFSVGLLFQNNGGNDINNITVEIAIEGETPTTQDLTLEQSLGFNQIGIAYVDMVATKPTKNTNVTVTIKSINNEDNNAEDASKSYSISVIPEGKALPRNVVIEEFTSISCPACPVGYTAMEQIHEEFGDGDVIPVCIHVNNPGRDPMTATTFNNLFNKYSSNGVPTSAINRSYVVYPLYEDLVDYAENIKLIPGIAQVTAEAELDRETSVLTVNTKTSFVFDYEDGDENFILSYAITEDNVGPYTQQNGYAGASGSIPGGWDKKPSTVNLIYNDVARQLDKYSGIKGSIPAAITAGETYEFSHDVKLNSSIGDPDNINLIVYLTNPKTGAIENACTIKNVGNSEITGIESVFNDNSDAPVQYFNLQGLRVNEPSNGIFIRRQGNKVSKILVK